MKKSKQFLIMSMLSFICSNISLAVEVKRGTLDSNSGRRTGPEAYPDKTGPWKYSNENEKFACRMNPKKVNGAVKNVCAHPSVGGNAIGVRG